MAQNQPDSNMSAPSFLNQQQQHPVPAGNDVIMNMMSSRQPSRITANLYSNPNIGMNQQNTALAPPPGSLLMPPQQQLTNNGNFVVNNLIGVNNMPNNDAICNVASSGNVINQMTHVGVSRNNSIVAGQQLIAPNQNNCGINSNAPQQQIQIAGLNGITFTLPQSSNPPSAHLTTRNGAIDSMTLSALNGAVPEFLYQLTKMLTDEGNKDVIVWNPNVCFGNNQIGG